MLALLTTLVLLFGFQGEQIIAQPLIIALLALPILIQVYSTSGLAYLLNRIVGSPHSVAAPSALIGASNFFELAVAAAISLFGFSSGAALTTVLGVLVEVPVMLSVVKVVNRSKGWYERGPAVGLTPVTRRPIANPKTPAASSSATGRRTGAWRSTWSRPASRRSSLEVTDAAGPCSARMRLSRGRFPSRFYDLRAGGNRHDAA